MENKLSKNDVREVVSGILAGGDVPSYKGMSREEVAAEVRAHLVEQFAKLGLELKPIASE